MKLNKNQKLLALSTLVVAIAILLFSCGNAVNNEVKTDSTINDTTLVDSVKVDSVGKK
jgi:hypothetical protein